jgi:peptide/nickel transport system substrate-binding protein
MKAWWKGLAAAAALLATGAQAQTLRAVMHSDLKIVDPIWTTAYITRNHGYMIYDTLFSMDERGEIKPQMVDRHDVSADKLSYAFTLRDGLLWHDGQPVTSEDVVASLKRWGGQGRHRPEGDDLRRLDHGERRQDLHVKLKEPTAFSSSRSQASSNVPFIMPKRSPRPIRTPRSGLHRLRPLRVQARRVEARRQGRLREVRQVQAAAEPASGLAGGKVVKVDRVEWARHQRPPAGRQRPARRRGRPDRAAAARPPAADEGRPERPSWRTRSGTSTRSPEPPAKAFRQTQRCGKPLDAFNQKDFLDAVTATRSTIRSAKGCSSCARTSPPTKAWRAFSESNHEQGRELLNEANYDGTPIVLMHSTDLQVLTNLAPVAKSLMERAGFKVDMQSMDWQSWWRGAPRRIPPTPAAGTPSCTSWVSADILNPVMTAYVKAGCDKALFGWPCDPEMERLRDQFARETDPAKQKQIAEAVQVRNTEVTTHIHLGQWYYPTALRRNVVGMPAAPVPVFWNIEKKG